MGAWPSKTTPDSSSRWSALPPELADLVLRRLSSLADRVRFASVCRHWLHVGIKYSPPCLPRVLPWLNFLDGSFRSFPDGELHFFRFRKHALCIGSFGTWLLFEEKGCRPSRRRFLKNPLCGATTRLPGHCNEPVDLNPDGSHGTRSSSTSTNFFIGKVIVCSSNLIAAKVNYHERPDVVVCCRPGMSSWSTGLSNGRWYQDMAFYKEKLFTVTTEGDLFVHEVTEDCDTGEPRVSRIEQVIQAPPPLTYTLYGSFYATLNCVKTCYLVISRTGKLLMVRWIVHYDYYNSEDSTKQMTMKVFEADLEMSQWLEVESLDDQVLFVSSDCSKAVSASSHGDNLQGNKIYFVDDGLLFWDFWPTSNPRTCGVYDMSSHTIHPISFGELHISDQLKASWFFP
ncbi:F-box protein SKIP23-like [Phragmites australis]|uniref:F-box protein SKIP23-like n=1 Tax=Phragmites australis TaxID=29695 RepID=UPI002D7A241F|nr:F-box protein SKIP23-like [Phragmites australis]